MNKQTNMARLHKRLATLNPQDRATRLAFLANRIEMDQREASILRRLEPRNPKPKDPAL